MGKLVWVPAVEVLLDGQLDGQREGDLFTCPVCGAREVRLYAPIHSKQRLAVQRNDYGEDDVFIPKETIPVDEVELESEGFYAECRKCRTAWSDDVFDESSFLLVLEPTIRLAVPREKLHPDVAAKLALTALAE